MSAPYHVPVQVELTSQDKMTIPWQQLFTNITNLLNQGTPQAKNNASGISVPQSVTIPVGKLTSGGANGSLTFTGGLLTAYVAPT